MVELQLLAECYHFKFPSKSLQRKPKDSVVSGEIYKPHFLVILVFGLGECLEILQLRIIEGNTVLALERRRISQQQ